MWKKTLEMLSDVGLNADMVYHKYPHQLSGGMRQRVMIAMAMIVWRIVIAEAKTGALLRLLCCRNGSFCFGGFEFADEL